MPLRSGTFMFVLALAACGSSSQTGANSQNANSSQNAASSGYAIADNTPAAVAKAQDLGPVDPSAVIDATVWLDLQNEGQLKQLVQGQTQKGSPNYHAWLSQAQFEAQFSPTSQEVNSVSNFASGHKLAIIDVAENNFYVKVEGQIADIEKAFHVQIENYSANGFTFRSNNADPKVNDPSGAHVAAITGLDDIGFLPNNVRAVEPDGTGAQYLPLSSVGSPNGFFFEGQCFRPPETHTFSGSTGSATYSGNRYGADTSNTQLGHLAPCGYSPPEMQTAYDLKPLYAKGLDGSGQTIVIVDAYGSATIQNDANVFSQIYGLPPVDLTVVKAPGLAQSPKNGWVDEVSLDVEWAHAMAPGAKIALVVATANSSLDEAINLAVVRHLGNTISNSWSSLEGFGNPAQLGRVERILMMAAATGIDVNFSSGDNGDERAAAGFITVDYPASSPFATGVGGTSLALNQDDTARFQTGWGTNLTAIANRASAGSPPYAPPFNEGFLFGAGGGSSLTFAKPAWQTAPGATRQVPDVSMLADPYTGAEIILTVGGQLSVGAIGGTSLACPMFSGVMAIAAQAAGRGLGQAAPLLYGLSSGLTDVNAVGSATNVTGSVNGTPYSSAQLAAPLDGVSTFYSAFYNSPYSTRWFVLTFGTDSSLVTGPGYDNVTGLGTPDGASFVSALAQ